ncbi:hypothetical protein K456DRAFT_897918 [Colletotrichum gloeosporioides 23]|nr:hypothetical protein K456DRAFT_897918 [Colletotrichum gloeosporioides 23]
MLVEELAYSLVERGREARCLAFTITSPCRKPNSFIQTHHHPSPPPNPTSNPLNLPNPIQHSPHPHPKKGKKTPIAPCPHQDPKTHPRGSNRHPTKALSPPISL